MRFEFSHAFTNLVAQFADGAKPRAFYSLTLTGELGGRIIKLGVSIDAVLSVNDRVKGHVVVQQIVPKGAEGPELPFLPWLVGTTDVPDVRDHEGKLVGKVCKGGWSFPVRSDGWKGFVEIDEETIQPVLLQDGTQMTKKRPDGSDAPVFTAIPTSLPTWVQKLRTQGEWVPVQ